MVRGDRKRGWPAYSTKTERDAATEFVRSYRLSIAHAFHRKLVRKYVVAELLRLYERVRPHRTRVDISPPLT